MDILVTDASGFIGSALFWRFTQNGHRVIALRRSYAPGNDAGPRWNPEAGQVRLEAAGALEAVVHLAGENIAQRWSSAAKARIRASRVDATRLLCKALVQFPIIKQYSSRLSHITWVHYVPPDKLAMEFCFFPILDRMTPRFSELSKVHVTREEYGDCGAASSAGCSGMEGGFTRFPFPKTSKNQRPSTTGSGGVVGASPLSLKLHPEQVLLPVTQRTSLNLANRCYRCCYFSGDFCVSS